MGEIRRIQSRIFLAHYGEKKKHENLVTTDKLDRHGTRGTQNDKSVNKLEVQYNRYKNTKLIRNFSHGMCLRTMTVHNYVHGT